MKIPKKKFSQRKKQIISKRVPRGYWTFEKCKEKAQCFSHRSEWAKNHNTSYIKASSSGWLDLCCEHMKRKKYLREDDSANSEDQASWTGGK